MHPEPPKPSSAIAPTFTTPGILSYQGGQWVGSEHLYNLSNNIPVVINIFKPEGLQLGLTQDSLQKRIEAAFVKEGINVTIPSTGNPPLPFFNISIMIISIGEGVASSCSGRLFELVDNNRTQLERGVFWQAITWEDQQLTVSSREQATQEITTTVDAITATFLERYNLFQKRKP